MRQDWFRRIMCLAMVCVLAVTAAVAGVCEGVESYSEAERVVEAPGAEESSAGVAEAEAPAAEACGDASAPEESGDAAQEIPGADEDSADAAATEEPAAEAVEDAVGEASLELDDLFPDGDGDASTVDEDLLFGDGAEAAAKDFDAEALSNDEGISIDAIHFPDATFRAIISSSQYDMDGDGVLSEWEINATKTMDVTGYKIYSLRGIEYFSALKTLKCGNNKLTNLDVSKNAALTSLDVSQNELKALDISSNTELTMLDCSGNDLTSLDLSQNLLLSSANVSGNEIKTLDISDCPLLREIVKQANYRTSQNTYGYYAGADRMLVLEIGALIYPLPVDEENFPDAGFRAWVLAEVDENRDGLLTQAEAEKITEANFASYSPIITSLVGIEHFPALVKLDCSGNALTELSLSANTALKALNCSGNALTTLNVGHCTSLTEMDCSSNSLTTLDVSALSQLKRLDCRGNLLLVLTLPKQKKLEFLDCGKNRLTSLDISGCTNLTTLCCENNSIAKLNLSDASVLMRIFNPVYLTTSSTYYEYVDGDAMLRFDITVKMSAVVINMENFPDTAFRAWVEANCDIDHSGTLSDSEISAVTGMDLSGMGIASLKGLEYFTALLELDCSNNALTSLSLTGQPLLLNLDCSGNTALSSLNLTANVALEILNCADCALTTLSLSRNSRLGYLDCSGNRLTSLQIEAARSLQTLYCHSNQLDELDISGLSDLKCLSCHYNQIDSLALYQCEAMMLLYAEDYLVQATPYFLFKNSLGYALSFDMDVDIQTAPVFLLMYDTSLDCSVGSPFRIVVRDGVIVEKFHSENRKVASVDETGLVIPEGEGKTTIHVRILDGDTLYLKLKVDDPTMPTGIELVQSGTVTLDLYDTLELDYDLLPLGTAVSDVKWHSDNTRVAKVDDDGVVTPRKEGTATITATTKRGNKKAKVKIKVVDSTVPSSITLSESGTVECALQDEPLQLYCLFYPEGTFSEVKWTSSATKVAKVSDDGLVTFRNAGTTTITATTKKGNKKAKVKVKVVDGAEPESVTIEEGSSITLDVGETIELTPEVETKGGYEYTGSFKWSSSKKKVASVDSSGFVIAKKPGTAKITVETKNKKKKASIYVYVN